MTINVTGWARRAANWDPRQVRVEARGLVNDSLLKQLERRLPGETDRIARKWANRMADYASALAPRSAKSGSNSRNDVPMAENIKVTGLNARYYVFVDDPAAKYVISGTRPHIIRAGALGATGTVNRTARRIGTLERRLDRASIIAGDRFTRSGRKRTNFSIRESVRRISASSSAAALTRQIEGTRATRNRVMRAGGKAMLAFPWAGGRDMEGNDRGWNQRVNGRSQRGMFVGPLVHHPGTKGNNFLAIARSRVAPGFARDLRNLLEGR